MFGVRNWEIREIEGKILTLIESMGVPQKQEDAVKGLVRQAIWTTIDTSFRIVIDDEMFEKVVQNNRQKEGEKIDTMTVGYKKKSK